MALQAKLLTNRNLKEITTLKNVNQADAVTLDLDPSCYSLDTMAFSRVLTLDEAIQTFGEKEDSCMFSLKVKPP